MLTGGFVGGLGEFAYQFLEDVAHLLVADRIRVEVGLGEVLEDLQKEVVGGEVHDGVLELVPQEDVPHVAREGVDVVAEVLFKVVWIALQ